MSREESVTVGEKWLRCFFWGRKNCSFLTSDSKVMSNLNVQEFLENLHGLARKGLESP